MPIKTFLITSVYEWYDDVPRRLFNLYDYEHPPENLDSLTPKYVVKKKLGTSIILAGDQESASEGVLGKVIESFTHGFQYRNLDNLTFGLYGINNDEWDWGYTEEYSTSFILGGMTADVLGLTAGIFEMAAGLTEITGGTALSSTGAGAVIGVPLINVGSATVAVGATTAGTSLGNLGEDTKTLANDLYSKANSGETGKNRNKPKENGTPNTTEIVRDENGNIVKYTTYGSDGKIVKEVRITGKDHGDIPRPNVKEPKYNTNPATGQQFQNGYEVRPAQPKEIPKNILK